MKGIEFRIQEKPTLTIKEMRAYEYQGLLENLKSYHHFQINARTEGNPAEYRDVTITLSPEAKEEEIFQGTLTLIDAVKKLKRDKR